MAARTVTDIDADLAAVNTAITGILTGAQSARAADGRQLTRADLETLRQMKNDLIAERKEIEAQATIAAAGAILLGEV
ncbi:MAG: hypothetical protein ABIG68_11150 [Acidobacteriota bacterium]